MKNLAQSKSTKFEDTKWVIRKPLIKGQYNDQNKKDNRTNVDLKNATQKTIDGTYYILISPVGLIVLAASHCV
jgi:hypothetical protein